MFYLLHIVILIGVFAILAESLNLVAGYTGLLSICQAAFFGVGAYVSALVSIGTNLHWPASTLVAMMASALIATILGAVSMRLRNELFVVASFAFQVVILNVMQNWIEVTQGSLGISGIPRPRIFGWRVTSQWEFALLSLILASLAVTFTWLLVTSPRGRMLKAIREDEVFAESLGKNTYAVKVSTFALGGMLASVAGSLYASYITYIDPSSFTVSDSVLILAIVIIGGAGSFWGPLVGSAALVILPELLRFVGLPLHAAANLRQIIYGGVLVLMMMYRPHGISGDYDFGG